MTTAPARHKPESLEDVRACLADALEDLRARLGDLKLHLAAHPLQELVPVCRHLVAIEDALAIAPIGRSADPLVETEGTAARRQSLDLLESLQSSATRVHARLCDYPFSFLDFLVLARLGSAKAPIPARWVHDYSQFLSECLRSHSRLADTLHSAALWFAERP
ncbi:MAG: hypothetical protein IT458_06760 [Planctomycetes bacterium]|nr:hypothetical protein [Planctomycetota bacterium]